MDDNDPPYMPVIGSRWVDNKQIVYIVEAVNKPSPQASKFTILFRKLDSKALHTKKLSTVLSEMWELGIGGWTPARLGKSMPEPHSDYPVEFD